MGQVKGRECSPCTLCCQLLSIPELNKPAGEKCKAVGSRGCAVYHGRPASCRGFKCLWLHGSLPRFMRPDRVGVVMHRRQDLPGSIIIMTVPGKKLSKKIQQQITKLSYRHTILVNPDSKE